MNDNYYLPRILHFIIIKFSQQQIYLKTTALHRLYQTLNKRNRYFQGRSAIHRGFQILRKFTLLFYTNVRFYVKK